MAPTFPENFGRYTLLERVAFGGMAEILLALEETAQAGKRFVTIKRIRPEHAKDPDYIDFFIGEGRVSMECSHPNLLRSFDLDTANGIHYLAMEYFRGHTLLDLISACHDKGERLSIPCVMRITYEVAAGLDHLHKMLDGEGRPLNVVHRDVTPQNIMFNASGAVKLIDLGIARSEMQLHQTKAGTVKGKLSYIAPELLNPSNAVDLRVDLFCLGIVMHEMFTSTALFRGDSDADTLRRIRSMDVPLISSIRTDIPREVDAIVAKALTRDPRLRYQSASELLLDIESLPPSCGPSSIESLRDETLALCGDPPVPTLGAASFSALKNSLRSGADSSGDPQSDGINLDPSIEYFIDRCTMNGADST